MTTVFLLGSATLALLLGAVASLAAARNRRLSGWISVAFVALAAVAVWAVVVRTFAAGPDAEAMLLALPSLGASLSVRVDHLSALFLAIASTIAVLTTLYSVRYMERFERDGVAKYYPLLLVLFAAIFGVVATNDFLFFLVAWELMTLASFFLVAFERDNRAAQRAALKYFIVSHAATFGMVAAALILWTKSDSFHFVALRSALGATLASQPFVGHLVLFLLFMGFATKAGILPMGSWLPDAYPAAPSGATAAFGGTLSKLGIYGLLRVYLDLLPLSSATEIWGFVIAFAGLVSLFVGTLTALKQDDTKRLMSFHVIGQMGYMFLGIGIGLALLRSSPALGTVALLGGVFHMLNNSLYKSSLFLGAGVVEYRVGTSSLGAGGGLGAMLPVTALCALSAALAIAGVPPLNGFASKWLLYLSGILGGQTFTVFAVAAVVAMFISLVTLASFLKYLGGTFLGPTTERQGIREAPGTMVAPQVVLTGLCLLFGLVPLLPLQFIHRAIVGLPAAGGLPALEAILGSGPAMRSVGVVTTVGAWAPLWIALALVLLGVLSYFGLQRAGGAEVREVSIWTCGEELEPAAIRYPAASFYRSFKDAFHGVYPAVRADVPAFPPWLRRVFDLDRWLYLPFARSVDRAARSAGRTHTGIPQVYLLWIVVGAIVVMTILLLAIG